MLLYTSNWNQVGSYEWVYNGNGGEGFATLANAPLNEPLPAGDYILRIQNYIDRADNITVETFFLDQQGTVSA